MPRPEAFREILGASFVKKQEEPVLTIGGKSYDKYDFVHEMVVSRQKKGARDATQ